MNNCRILTQEDKELIPSITGIFNSRLRDIASLYTDSQIEEVTKKYTTQNFQKILAGANDQRIVGHFTNNTLDGVLIEESVLADAPGMKVKVVTLQWVMAQKSAQGIGTALIKDCIERAKARGEDAVALGVVKKNNRAVQLYKRLGFEYNQDYEEGRRQIMHFYINPEVRPQ